MVHKITMENLSHWLKHTISFIPSPFQSRTELVSRSFLCEWSEVWWSESYCPVRREGETSYCVSLKATGATGALKTTGSALLSSGALISIISSCSGDCDTRLRRQLGYFKTLRRLIAAICIQNRSLSHSSVKCEHADAIHIFLHSVWEISHVSARQVKEEKHHIAIIWQIVLWWVGMIIFTSEFFTVENIQTMMIWHIFGVWVEQTCSLLHFWLYLY